MLNFLIKKIGKFIYEKFVRLAQNISGSPWEKAMEDPTNKPFYEHVARRMEQYFGE